jgi:hypothetical protein
MTTSSNRACHLCPKRSEGMCLFSKWKLLNLGIAGVAFDGLFTCGRTFDIGLCYPAIPTISLSRGWLHPADDRMSVDNDEVPMDSKGSLCETACVSLVIVSVVSAIDVTSGDEVQIKVADQSLVAHGGWATVYRAQIVPDGELIAIKKVKETRQYKVASSD